MLKPNNMPPTIWLRARRGLIIRPTSYTPTLHSVHRLVFGETLDRVAAQHYADPTRWRLIAEANGIVDPIALRPGDLLVIPELPVRHRG